MVDLVAGGMRDAWRRGWLGQLHDLGSVWHGAWGRDHIVACPAMDMKDCKRTSAGGRLELIVKLFVHLRYQ